MVPPSLISGGLSFNRYKSESLRKLIIILTGICWSVLCVAQDKMKDDIEDLLQQSMQLQRTDQQKSYKLAEEARKLSQEISYTHGIAAADIRMGSIVYTNGATDSARQIIINARQLYSALHEVKGIAGANLLLSYIYEELGMKDSSFAVLYEALKLNEQTTDTLMRLQIYINLGNLHLGYGKKTEALKNFREAEKLANLLNNANQICSAYDGLGRYYLDIADARKALWYFLKADSISRELNDVYSVAQNLTNIALSYELLKNYPLATTKYKEALQACEALEMRTGVALGEYNLGNILLLQHKTDEAIMHLNKAAAVAKETDDLIRLANTYQVLAEAYAGKGDHKQAWYYEKQYAALNDSILNTEKVSQIAEMETRFDTQKKIQQIQLLEEQGKTKHAQRNIFIVGTILFLLLAIAIGIGLMKTRKEKQVSENLLLNILPSEVAEELKEKGSAQAQFFDEVTVLFTDFKDFTQITEKLSPAELVDLLHYCFKSFDIIITKHHVEKIKTIGDSYMCAGGLPVPHKSTPQDVVNAALEIQEFMEKLKQERLTQGKEPIEMRLGIHTGPVVAGIVGVKKFAYDIWGDTVNTASRMESSGAAGRVNISASTYEKVKHDFICTSRGFVEAKHKGLIEMYFVEGKLNAV